MREIAAAGGSAFVKWQRDGADLSAQVSVTVTMSADHSLLALFVVFSQRPRCDRLNIARAKSWPAIGVENLTTT
jgi:hypothetical protein